MKSDTPRTDRETYDVVESRLGNIVATNLVDSDFARTLERELNVAQAENTRLRAALANSDQPCAYCTLPADEIAKCPSGFPGCGRMDDAMGCPELGAAVQLAAAQARIAELKAAPTPKTETVVNYREHRGTFADSIATSKPVRSMEELRESITAKSEDKIEIKPYGFDARIGGDTYSVVLNGEIRGFLDGPPPAPKEETK